MTPQLAGAFAELLAGGAPGRDQQPLGADALQGLFAQVTTGLAGERPLIWIVEDLQFAGELTRQVLSWLANLISEHRVLLVLTARPGLPPEFLANLQRSATIEAESL